MDALVTLKASPAELNLLRSGLCALAVELVVIANDKEVEPAERRKARADLLRVNALQDTLR